MKGLCIGTGEWRRVAARAAAQMEHMTGVPCSVVDRVDNNLVHSSWHKLNLLRDHPGESLLIFDADLWCAQPWDPQIYADTGLAMVPEPPTEQVKLECALYHVPVGRYCNGGLIIADGRSSEVFAAAKRLHPYYGRWLEQTGMNHEIHARGFPLRVMPTACNRMIDAGQPLADIAGVAAINKHFAGPKALQRLHDVFDALDTAARSQRPVPA